MENKKTSIWQKLIYSCAGVGDQAMSMVLASFLTAYYTDTAGIAAATVAFMFVICRVFDGITDIAMGSIVDKTHTKLGKARPWIIIAAPLMLVGLTLLVSVHQFALGNTGKVIYAYATYIFLNAIVYTMFKIGHMTLLARMTRNFQDRNITATVSSVICSIASSVFGTVIALMYNRIGWTMTGLILGVIACVMLLITGFFCKENVGMQEEKKPEMIPLKQQLPAALKNRYFWLLLLLGMLCLMINANASGSLVYYCIYIIGNPDYMATLMSVGTIPAIIFTCLMPVVSHKFSKRAFLILSGAMFIVSFLVLAFAGDNKTLLLVGTMIRVLAFSPIMAASQAYVADVADYGEWKSGIRSEGLMSSAQSVGAKLGIGFGSAMTAWVLAAAKFQGEPTEAVISAIKFDHAWLNLIFSVIIFIVILLLNVEKYIPEINASKADNK